MAAQLLVEWGHQVTLHARNDAQRPFVAENGEGTKKNPGRIGLEENAGARDFH